MLPSPSPSSALTGNMLFPSSGLSTPVAVVVVGLILLMNQHLCAASWATRTTQTPTQAPPTPAYNHLPLVSSSEATLLTAANDYQAPAAPVSPAVAATLRASHHAKETDTNDDGAGDGATINKNRYKIVSVHTHCTRDLFEMQLHLNRAFHGLLYTKDFPLECRVRGDSQTNVTLRIPTSGCGVRVEPHASGDYMELSVRVMLQMERKLRQSTDILRTVRCKMPLNAMGMRVDKKDNRAGHSEDIENEIEHKERDEYNFRNGRMRAFDVRNHKALPVEQQQQQQRQPQTTEDVIADSTITARTSTTAKASAKTSISASSATTSTPRVHIWLELGDRDGSGAVEVGQATTLTVRAKVPRTMGVRVVDCAAFDGLGESTQQLLDDRGCPIDEQVMPALHSTFRPIEDGWSKPHEDDVIEKIYTATFPAFKFPDRERLHVSCGVQLCKLKCPTVNCSSTDTLILNADTHLARIEVFNSLAVTAPQIEADRFLRYERHHNMSAEEYPPNVRPLPTEGTLCLSISKLAISFCILGLIFLIAVIVALCSLIRSRRRSAAAVASATVAAHGCALRSNGNRLHRAEVCTSMFSSSSESAQSARFASKLFMPYYPNSMPYGRVY